ncbi:MAG: vitamin K epoxide reductase family protein [Chloroflexi bacterium]|nr:vitamin K epoxide reductase family protein [Chloroflexota bacterium]
MTLLALVAIGALGYLAWVKLTNTNAVCFVVQGCDQVQASEYSRFLGIPVAIYGLAMVLTVLASVIAWWRTGDRRLLYVPYTLGLISVFVIVALVYLELFVIHAICIWCTAAGASLVLGWIVSIVALRRSAREG